MKTNIGIKEAALAEIAHSLNVLLADENLLYIKTRNAHWNVEGADFHSMHLFFETQYNEIAQMADDIAERIRSLGHYAVGTMKEFLDITHLTETKFKKNDSIGFIKQLLEDHESIIIHIRENYKTYEEKYNDAGTSDFVIGLLQKHEKMSWMLRSHL